MKKYPIKLAPQMRTALWGRELWLVSGVPSMPSVVENGEYAGRTLPELTEDFGKELVGARASDGNVFPLLVKIIEAEDRLSLQVHPSETTRKLCGGDPKTEMWYVLDGAPDACIFAGLREGVGRDDLVRSLHGGAAEETVVRFDVKRGDALFIPGGLVHAIGAGCRLYEVPQTSDTTWRLHDWDRVDLKTGLPRPLHEREGLAAIDWTLPPPSLLHDPPPSDAGSLAMPLIDCAHFRFSSLALSCPATLPGDVESFRILFAEEGVCSVAVDGAEPVPLAAGECALVPEGVGAFAPCLVVEGKERRSIETKRSQACVSS